MAATTVADLVADGLARARAARIFTAGTGSSPPALLRAAERRTLSLVSADGAAEATLMAAITGELADAPGAVILTDAGVEAARPALRYAAASRAPLIVLTERAAGAAMAPLLKGVIEVEPASAAHWIAHAVQRALADPRGPVAVVIPPGVATAAAVPVATSLRPVVSPPPVEALDDAARLLVNAARPVLVVGLECRTGDAAGWLRPFAETLPAPALTTLKGKGVLPDPHPLVLGLVGSAVAHSLLDRADLIVAVGVDPIEGAHSAWPVATTVLHLGRVSHALRTTVELIGDVALLLEELAPRIRARSRADWDVAELDRLKRSATARARAESSRLSRVLHAARELTPAGTIAVVGPGALVDTVAAAWPAVAPNELLIDGELPDFAPSAAVAAALHHPDRQVICVTTAATAALSVIERLALSIVTVSLSPVQGLAAGGIATATARDEPMLRASLDRAVRHRGAALIDASNI